MASRSTITQAQAEDRVAEIIMSTIAALDPKPALEAKRSTSGDLRACTAGVPPPADQLAFTQTYYLAGVKADQFDVVARQFKAFWVKQGWLVTGGTRPGSDLPDLFGGTHEGFRFSLQSDGSGNLTFGATSPCFWVNGTPEPSPPDRLGT